MKKDYKFYLKASEYFLNDPNYADLTKDEKEYHHFASVILSWVCLEFYVNTVSESLSKGKKPKIHEKYFLLEKELKVGDEGKFQKIRIRPTLLKKILFILNYFTNIDVKSFKQTEIWNNLRAFEDVRNKILHSKEEHPINIDYSRAVNCKKITEDTIKYMNKKIFG